MKYLLYYKKSLVKSDGYVIINHKPKSIIYDDFNTCYDQYVKLNNLYPLNMTNGDQIILSDIRIFKEGIYGAYKDYI